MTSSESLPDWARLFRVACGLIHQVNSKELIIDHWTFGSGTAMMLQIDHRESRDVDIFLRDPQLLSFLDPQKRDFKFDIVPDERGGDGSTFIKPSKISAKSTSSLVNRRLRNPRSKKKSRAKMFC